MRMRTVEIGVGAFMLAGILALVVLALNVSGLNPAEQTGGYKVYARFDNIGGLRRGPRWPCPVYRSARSRRSVSTRTC